MLRARSLQFRNTLRLPNATCEVCTTPIASDYSVCYACSRQAGIFGLELADNVGIVTYARQGWQSGWMMHRYKDPSPLPEHTAPVQLLIVAGVHFHGRCAGRLAGSPITRWARVPSLHGRLTHPLADLVRPWAPWAEYLLTALNSASPREVRRDHFQGTEVLSGDHVLIVDDTWTTGAQLQSAALTLRAAGADHVSALALARWLVPSYPPTQQFIDQELATPYDPDICPWTGGACP